MIRITKYLLIVFFTFEIIYISFSYGKDIYDFHNEKSKVSKINKKFKDEINIFNNMKSESITPSITDKKIIEKSFLNKEFLSGIKIKKVDTMEKISKKGVRETFFTVKLYFDSKDKEIIKKLAILLFLNPEVFKLSEVNKEYIEIILERVYG